MESGVYGHRYYHGGSDLASVVQIVVGILQIINLASGAFTNGCPLCWRARGFKFERFMARMDRDLDSSIKRVREEAQEKREISNEEGAQAATRVANDVQLEVRDAGATSCNVDTTGNEDEWLMQAEKLSTTDSDQESFVVLQLDDETDVLE